MGVTCFWNEILKGSMFPVFNAVPSISGVLLKRRNLLKNYRLVKVLPGAAAASIRR